MLCDALGTLSGKSNVTLSRVSLWQPLNKLTANAPAYAPSHPYNTFTQVKVHAAQALNLVKAQRPP
ncbi:hypothetical protein QP415_11350, partial [Pauljensenia sp. UMB3104]|uniref:hypothetical protein n=1 Tax=Pauljensenia sp. UMB3104 TaxID=3046331 RepID=UPI00254DD1D1